MSRRIDIELTSRSNEDTWTWRAAGAKQPKGTVSASLVPEGATPGSQFRAEVDMGLEGIDVLELLPPKATRSPERSEGRIEVLGAPKRAPDVSVILAPGSRRRRDGDDRPPRREGGGRGQGQGGSERSERGPARQGGSRPGADRSGGRGDGPRGAGPGRDREKRTPATTVHRNAALAELGPEQLPIAEQLLRGGIPAVRQAIDEQNKSARAAGKPPVAAEPILAIAEKLAPVVSLATWKDRASAAQTAGKDLRLRELRAVVAASRTVTLDDEGRAMAKALRESLDHRVTALQEEWVNRITHALDGGKVLDALRISANPPEPGTRCPAELAVRLAEAASAAMTADLEPTAWLDLLGAVVDSPVRRNVRPSGLPANDELHATARNSAGLVPELAKLLGLRIPPPPPRRTVVRRGPLTPAGGGGPTAGP